MPKNLRRITGVGELHFITFCCYQRRALLNTVRARNLAIRCLQQTRLRYGFALVGYVFMPEHVHLLLRESGSVRPAKIIQSFKQRVSRALRARKRKRPGQLAFRFSDRNVEFRRFWQRRYYDFNVYSRAKAKQKLHYMHENPVRAKLVKHPADWPWSSWCDYYRGEGLLRMDPWG
jgi:putative transposase